METITKKNFEIEKIVKVCYVFGVTVNKDNVIEKVHYFRFDDEEKDFVPFVCSVPNFAKKIIDGQWLAYAGKKEGNNDNLKINNPSLVTVKTIDGVLHLTTASDDSTSNNLLNLPRY